MARKKIFNPLAKKGFDAIDEATAEDGVFTPLAGTLKDNVNRPLDNVTLNKNGNWIEISTNNSIFNANGLTNVESILISDASESQFNGRYFIYGSSPFASTDCRVLFGPDAFSGAFTGTVSIIETDVFEWSFSGNVLSIVGGVGTVDFSAKDASVVIGSEIAFSRTNLIYTFITGTITNIVGNTVTFSTTHPDWVTTLPAPNQGIGWNGSLILPKAPVTGIIEYDVHPEDLPEFDDFSVVDKKYVDDQRPFTLVDGSYSGESIPSTDPHLRLTGTIVGGTSFITQIRDYRKHSTTPVVDKMKITTVGVHGLVVAEQFEIVGSPVTNGDGTWVVDNVINANTIDVSKVSAPSTSTGYLYYSYVYSGSASAIIPDIPITGNVEFVNGVGVMFNKDDGSKVVLDVADDNSVRVTDV